jgi:putative ABC transport system ATP-binding protein
VLADEPTANLDSETGEGIIELMKKMNQEIGTTFIFSTHDQTIVSIADHVLRLKDGMVVQNERKVQGARI